MFGFRKKVSEYFGDVICIVNGRLEMYSIEEESEGVVQAGGLLLPLEEGTEYFSASGERYLVYGLSVPALIEAESVRKIRESEVVKGLFEAPEPKRFMDYLPLIVLGLVTMLTLVLRR